MFPILNADLECKNEHSIVLAFKSIQMECPICLLNVPGYHRMCLVQLFRENKIQSVADWERRVGLRTIVKGKRIVKIKPG